MDRKKLVRVFVTALCTFVTVHALGCDTSEEGSAESEASACTQVTTGGAWWNQAFAEQTGRFHVEVDATPSVGGLDAVIGLSDGSAATWSKLAAIVRFNPNGTFDARNGSAYQASQVHTYSAGTPYRFRFDVDLRTRTYSVWWKFTAFPDGYRLIGRDYAFRTEQAAVSRLTNIAAFVNPETGAAGGIEVCNATAVADSTTADGCFINTPNAGFANKSVGATSQVMVVDVEARAGAANMDGVFGVTSGPADAYDDFAASVRFFTNGMLEARDAGAYRADRAVPYQPGELFMLRFVIDVWSRKYSVFVSAPGTPEPGVELARNYRFRPQATGTTLDNVATIVASSTGRFDACNARGGDAAPAVHVRPGHFSIWPLSGENVLMSNETSTMWIDAVGRVQRTLPRGGAIAADSFANYYISRALPAGSLAVEALTPTFTTRWNRTYPIPPNGTVIDTTMFGDGTLALYIYYADRAPTLERIGSDGTYLGSVALPAAATSLDTSGYALMRNDTNGVIIDRYNADGSFAWSRSYPGPFSASEIATGPNGNIVIAGNHSAMFQFGTSTVNHHSHPDADNTFVASIAPNGDPLFARFLDSTWFGGLATNGTRLVVARQKHIGPIINEYMVWDVSGANPYILPGTGLSSFGRSFGVEMGTANRVYARAEMSWPDNFTPWGFTVGVGP